MRVPQMTVGDIRAQLAACHIGERAVLALIERYGVETFTACADDLIDYTERLVRAEIASWPDGSCTFTDYLDSDGVGGPRVKIRVTVTVEGDSLTADFTGTDPQVRGAINSALSFTAAVVALCVRCVMREEIPNTEGMFRPLKIIAPEGTLVNVAMPGASSMRGVTGFRTTDAVFGALAGLLPDRVLAAGEGGNTLVIIGGPRADRSPYVYYELLSGIWGARPDRDGNDGLCNPANVASNIPIEQAECECPVRVERYGLVRDSGGAGKYRGGMGIEREWTLLSGEAHLAIRSDRRARLPYGLYGGKPATGSTNILHGKRGEEELPTMISTTMRAGERLYHRQAGGGGWGDPFERDPEAVARDVANGKVSVEKARADYGVVLDAQTLAVDKEATALAPDGPLAGSTFHGAYTWAAWFFRHFVRAQKALSPQEAVRRATSLPASRLGLGDRGVVRKGAWADLAVFDPEAFAEQGTTFEPNRTATGMRHVLVNGKVALRDGALTGELDARRAGAAHVLRAGDRYLMYYWGTDAEGYHRILLAESRVEEPNAWTPMGSVLERQPGTDYNDLGPGFPFVVPRDDGPWLLYFCGWGKPRADGKLPNTTGVAFSDDGGRRFYYEQEAPVLPLDREWDCEGTGSVFVLREGAQIRMYYMSIGRYFDRPEGAETGHGDVIPRIGVGYAVSDDGVAWTKPVDGLVVSPRGFDTEPYEYISSKPFILREAGGYRMWVHTFGTAYRVRSLVSRDGLEWRWNESGPEGEFGTGEPGAFDDRQRCYVSVVKHGDAYRCWYMGNGFGATGMGYAEGKAKG